MMLERLFPIRQFDFSDVRIARYTQYFVRIVSFFHLCSFFFIVYTRAKEE